MHGQNELNLDQYNYITSNITDNNDELIHADMTNLDDSTIFTTMTIPLLDSNTAEQISGWLDQEEADSTMNNSMIVLCPKQESYRYDFLLHART